MLKFFEKYPEILAVLSERKDGSMKLFNNSNINVENRNRFFEKIGIDENSVVAAEIVHKSNVETIYDSSVKVIPEVDGLATNKQNIFLSITVADCIPVYFYEPERKIIALAHCGWRGIIQEIIKNTLEKIENLGGNAQNFEVALGPGIDKCHFEIKEDILNQFKKYPNFIEKRDSKIFIDLKGIIRKQLTEIGIKPENIEESDECTFENHSKYFSYRKDKPKAIEAMVAVIGYK
ncbi:MAG: peptidoglycan editing factor PgeF [bacterium]|nr:peptidoglycan editing factor PgeF [bacterium]